MTAPAIMVNMAILALPSARTASLTTMDKVIAGPASIARIRPDGHIYNTIRYGRRRMPSYRRIPSQDRWDIVNYVKYMNQPGVELW